MKLKQISIKTLADLQKVKLPGSGWSVARLEVLYERKGQLGEWATVVYDTRNETFYVHTNKAIVYESDSKTMLEAISLMKQVNKVLKRKKS